MTVASETSRSGPYTGNGVTNVFDYGFRILNENHLRVIRTEGGVETVLTIDTDYIVSDVGEPGGGQIALVTPPTASQTITILRDVPFTQETDLENQGPYFAETVEEGFDAGVMRDQQLAERLDRAIVIPASADPSSLNALVEDVLRLSDSADAIDAVANNETNINTVAGISADVTTVAGVANDIPTVAALSDEIAAIGPVASDIPTIAANVDDITNFADVYQGPKASDPTLRNNGSALQAGDLYFNTSSNLMKVRTAAGEWADASALSLNIATKAFVGDGTETDFVLDTAPGVVANLLVEVGGVLQTPTTDYTVSGQTLTFVSPPANGAAINTWVIATVSNLGVPADNSVGLPALKSDVSARLLGLNSVGLLELKTDVLTRLISAVVVTPQMFGAKGDGVTNDYAALVACIQDGRPVEWGGPSNVYRVETEIDETVTHAISWRSSGATIKYDGAGAPRSTVTLKVHPLVHQIDGVITFDGNNKAHAGIYVTNAAGSITGSVYPSLTASRVRAINIYRSNISFGSSCGILVHGDFEQVNLLHPYVKDVHGAAAAQNPSIAGLSGITVTRGTTDYPRSIFVLNPHVENIFVNDGSNYIGDQDGIVLFGYVGEASGALANSYDAKVVGGTVRNVRGRSLKGQIRNATIDGLSVVKDTGVIGIVEDRVFPDMGDIELQLGEGQISNISFTLDTSCQNLIRVYAPDNVLSAPAVVSGIRAVISNVQPQSAISFSQRKNGAKNWFSASDVTIANGAVTYGVLIDDNSTSATGQTLCNLSDFVGRFGSAFVVGSNALVANGYINIVNVINATATVPAYSGNVGWTVNKLNTISLS